VSQGVKDALILLVTLLVFVGGLVFFQVRDNNAVDRCHGDRRRDVRRGRALRHRREDGEHTMSDELDGAMHSVWLHGNWRWLTQNMTTPEKEAAWAAVQRYSAALAPDEEPLSDEWAWWR
jgi:hypothetical protein